MGIKNFLNKQGFKVMEDNEFASEFCSFVFIDDGSFEIANNNGGLTYYGSDIFLAKQEVLRLKKINGF